jgi:prepilin-type N-terminal cleavage/methylation domain-containing protein
MAGSARIRRAKAFTLPELLVVIGIIALLVAILMPSMSQAWHVAADRMCRSHLYRLGQTMHATGMSGGSNTAMTVTTSAGWSGAAVAYGSKDLLFCQEDTEPPAVQMSELQNYWILQLQHGSNWLATDVSLAMGFAAGEGQVLGDSQLFTDDKIPNPKHGPYPHTHQCWCKIPESRAANQKMIAITDEAELLATFEVTQVTLESWHGCGCTSCASDHWLMKGPLYIPPMSVTTPPTQNVVFRMGGTEFQAEPNPRFKHSVTSVGASYGMTDQITGRMVSPSQMMLMDANQQELVVATPGWMDHVKGRHFKKVNYVDVGGAVHTITKAALSDEFNLWQTKGLSSQSLIGYNASPQAGK